MSTSPKSVIPRGIYTPVTTFFNTDFSLDIDTQIKHAKMLYESGISGLVLAGSMGESAHLSAKERKMLVAEVRAAIPDRNFKLIAGIPPIGNIEEVVNESKEASRAGADFFIVLIQGYFGPALISQNGIIDYFTGIADGSALPIIIYNYPGTCNNVTIALETFQVLAQHENIVGVKLTHFNLDEYALLGKNPQLCESLNFRPFTGLGQILVPALSVGIYGAIDGLSALFPKTVIRLYRLFHEGRIEEAGELQYLVTRGGMMIKELNVVGVKHAIKEILGYGSCVVGRPPLSSPVNMSSYQKFKAILEELAKLERSL